VTVADKPLYVTRPYLPPLEEFVAELKVIWETRILTNCGPYHERLEQALCGALGVDHVSLFTNGTVALMTALEALNVRGEVITTPYSFVATAHAITKTGGKPVFVDVDAQTLNIDAARIERAITPDTTAILPVHCYGEPCDVDAIQHIASKHRLAVVYDAAHAFGVTDRGSSLLKHGDLSVLSFHATKVFNTFEGGAIVCRDRAMKQRIDRLRNFGIESDVSVTEVGGNGKMSEMNAALGILQLKYVDQAIERRRVVDALYRERLARIPGIRCLGTPSAVGANFAYFPILVEDEYGESRDDLRSRLLADNIHARRYFYPLISSFPMYSGLPSAARGNLPIAEAAAERVLCLPIFPDISKEQVDAVVTVIASVRH
jgi:dTDP-4-amino-4,6-dideoxygalactose transaminase